MDKKKFLFLLGTVLINIGILVLYSQHYMHMSVAILALIFNFLNILFLVYHTNYVKVLQEQVIKDQFTKIYNKAYFEEILAQKISYANRAKEGLALIMFDIDDFKNINDTHGHLVGDKVLIALTSAVKKSIRSYDIFSRVGGEEFAIIMTNTSYKEVAETSERIRTKVEHMLVDSVRITISVGVSTAEENDCVSSLYHRADEAMIMSKNTGKNTIHFPGNFVI